MLTDKVLNLFTSVICALQVIFFTSNLVASEQCVWGSEPKAEVFAREYRNIFFVGKAPERRMPTDQPHLAASALAAAGGEVFSAH